MAQLVGKLQCLLIVVQSVMRTLQYVLRMRIDVSGAGHAKRVERSLSPNLECLIIKYPVLLPN
jgi:hypothetical protein